MHYRGFSIYIHTHVNTHVFQNYFQTVLMSLLHVFICWFNNNIFIFILVVLINLSIYLFLTYFLVISSFSQNWPTYNLQGLHSVHTLLQGLLSIYMHPFARAFFSTPFGKGSLKIPFCKGLPFPKGLPFYKGYHSWL